MYEMNNYKNDTKINRILINDVTKYNILTNFDKNTFKYSTYAINNSGLKFEDIAYKNNIYLYQKDIFMPKILFKDGSSPYSPYNVPPTPPFHFPPDTPPKCRNNSPCPACDNASSKLEVVNGKLLVHNNPALYLKLSSKFHKKSDETITLTNGDKIKLTDVSKVECSSYPGSPAYYRGPHCKPCPPCRPSTPCPPFFPDPPVEPDPPLPPVLFFNDYDFNECLKKCNNNNNNNSNNNIFLNCDCFYKLPGNNNSNGSNNGSNDKLTFINGCKYSIAVREIAKKYNLNYIATYNKYKGEIDTLFSKMIKEKGYKQGIDYIINSTGNYSCAEVQIALKWCLIFKNRYSRTWKAIIESDIVKIVKDINKSLAYSLMAAITKIKVPADIITNESVNITTKCDDTMIDQTLRTKQIKNGYVVNNQTINTYSRLLLSFIDYIEVEPHTTMYDTSFGVNEVPIGPYGATAMTVAGCSSFFTDGGYIPAKELTTVDVTIEGTNRSTYIKPGSYRVVVENGTDTVISTDPKDLHFDLIAMSLNNDYGNLVNASRSGINLTANGSKKINDYLTESYYTLKIPDNFIGGFVIKTKDSCGKYKSFEYGVAGNIDIIKVNTSLPEDDKVQSLWFENSNAYIKCGDKTIASGRSLFYRNSGKSSSLPKIVNRGGCDSSYICGGHHEYDYIPKGRGTVHSSEYLDSVTKDYDIDLGYAKIRVFQLHTHFHCRNGCDNL